MADDKRPGAKFLREYKDAVQWARTQLVRDETDGINKIPGKFQSYDAVPWQLVEATIAVETGGTFDPNTVTGTKQGNQAIGLGQFVYGASQELAWYYDVSGYQVSREELYDPTVSIRLTAFGIGARWSQLQSITGGNDNWLLAVSGYFGCPADAEGNVDPQCSDGLNNSTGYTAQIGQYILDNFGQDVLDSITNEPGFDLTQRSRTTAKDAKDAALGIVDSIPAAITDAAKTLAIGLAVVAVIVVIGFAAAKAVGMSPENAVPAVRVAKAVKK